MPFSINFFNFELKIMDLVYILYIIFLALNWSMKLWNTLSTLL